jgi:hypothetical protein
MNKEFIPSPEFVTAEIDDRLTVYGWKIDHLGILAYGDTKLECAQNWQNSYDEEKKHEYNNR